MENSLLCLVGCALLTSGCGLFLERYPDPDDAGVLTMDALTVVDARDTSDVLAPDAADARMTLDSFAVPDAYALPDAFEFPDAHVCPAEVCNGRDDDCDGATDEESVCVVGGVTCSGHTHDGHAYILCDTDVTWEQAHDRCRLMEGFDMVKIESDGENGFVASLTATLDWMRRGGGWANAPRLWIGLRDNSLLTREWQWADGSALGTAYWHPPGPGLVENCVEMRGWASAAPGGFDYAWNDSSCSLPARAYLCEQDTP